MAVSKRAAIAVILGLLCILAFAGKTDAITDWLGTGWLARANESYLSSSYHKTLAGFGVMSLLKAGLAVIEGSAAGASLGLTAQVGIGGLVQPAYDCVDIAWKTLLAGSAMLLALRYLLQAAATLDSFILGMALLVFILFLFIRPERARLRRAARNILTLFTAAVLIVYYLLPLSVWGASHVSRLITAPAVMEAEEGFEVSQQDLFPNGEAGAENRGVLSRSLQSRLERVTGYLKDRARDYVEWTVKLIVGYLFDCVVFPLLFFLILYVLARGAIGGVFQRFRTPSASTD
ncbi:MAG: hypothetical protein B0D92_05270 [Spirochaeta sp. LUC14_002_19_P3]|nr:MAG: hypothetical protein B0D92_05270 [Spirochaeta sp. LUC14_002_19_P3]